MNTPLFLAKKLIQNKSSNRKTSKPIVRVAIASIAIGIIVLTLAFATGFGLKEVIKDKMQVYSSPIQISHLEYYSKTDYKTLSPNQTTDSLLTLHKGVKRIQKVAYQPALVKNGKEVNPVVLKGYSSDFTWENFENYMVEGRFPDLSSKKASKEIIISSRFAKKMDYSIGDDLLFYVINEESERAKVRILNIVGIYNVGVVEFDDLYIYGDLRVIQRLNKWKNNEFAVIEVEIDDYSKIDELIDEINLLVPFDLRARQIRHIYPKMFVWIDMFDTNIYILLIIIGLVASINLVSTILINILERVEMVGVLQSLGMRIADLRKVFLYYMMFLVGKGLLIGNIIGITICLIQAKFHIIPLDEESYHVSYVPINLRFQDVLILNTIFIIISLVVLIIPSVYIRKIKPVSVLKFK